MAAVPTRPVIARTNRSADAVRALARAARLLERACDGLSLAHYRVLAAVASGDERASRIASRLALGKPTISASVDALCQRGLLVRTGVEQDQRAVALKLTPAGAAVLATAEKAMTERLDTVVARTADPAAVLDALAALGEAIEGLRREQSQA